MTIPPRAGWALGRLLCGHELNGEAEGLPPPLRRLADHLAQLPQQARGDAWSTIQAVLLEGDELARAVAAANIDGPPPEDDGAAPRIRSATLADVRRDLAEVTSVWDGWIPSNRLVCVAADPGIGKTRTEMDQAFRAYHGLPWPDGQPMTLPAGSRTLWLCGDRNFDELAEVATEFRLPDEAIILNSVPEDPYGGLDLDDPDTIAALGERILAESPAWVVIDTIGMATGRNLCKPEEARAILGPLADMAKACGVPIKLLTHLSKDKEALGRRIIGACRVVWNLTQPDPIGQPDRRRLWVSKSYGIKPPPLGITMKTGGNEYDSNPPSEPAPAPPGRPSNERVKARDFIRGALAKQNDRIGNELCRECVRAIDVSEKTFWRAVDDMEADGELSKDGGKGTGRQMVLHLIRGSNDGADETPDNTPTP